MNMDNGNTTAAKQNPQPCFEGLGLLPDDLDAGFVAVITACSPSTMGKRIDAKGETLQPGNLVEGMASVVPFGDAEDLVDLLKSIRHDQALSPQRLTGDRWIAALVTTKRLQSDPGLAAKGVSSRTKDHFAAGGRGVVVVDYDPPADHALDRDELWKGLLDVAPGIAEGSAVWWCSSSSYLYNGDIEVKGLRGQRVYLLVEDTADTKRVLETLNKRLWLKGHGRIEVSAAGALLVRSLADEAMATGARLDYIGGVTCEVPWNQRRPDPVILSNGGWLDTRKAILDLTTAEEAEYQRLLARAKAEKEPEARKIRDERAAEREKGLVARLTGEGVPEGVAVQRARLAVEAAHIGALTGDFEVILATGEAVTVAEVLRDRQKYDGAACLDPIEPEYRGRKVCGHFNLSGNAPNLYSHAHGGKLYRLRRGKVHIQLIAGERDAIAEKIAAAVAADENTYLVDGAPSVLRRIGGRDLKLERFSPDLFAERAQSVVSFSRYDGRSEKVRPADADDATLRASRAKLPEQKAKFLRQIVKTPIVTSKGIIVTEPGYHEGTELYADISEGRYSVPVHVTRVALVEAVRTLWAPFRAYEFETAHSKAALIASEFGIVMRPALDTMPGLLVEAPSSNSGKSFVCQGLYAFAEGRPVTPDAPPNFGNSDETGKTLSTFAAEGRSVLFFDNLRGHIQSTHLEQLLTGRGQRGRQVGFGHSVGGSWRPYVMMTSNNASLNRDIARRLLRVRIEPSEKGTTDRRFAFSPEGEALRSRDQMIQALVTVMKAFADACMPVTSRVGSDYPEWDHSIRQCILWLAAEGVFAEAGLGDVGDPAFSIREEAGVNDAESVTRAKLLHGLWEVTRGFEFTASTLLAELRNRCGPISGIVEALDEMAVMRGSDLPGPGTIGKVLGNLKGARYDGLAVGVRQGGGRTSWWSVRGGEPLPDDEALQVRLRGWS